MVELFSGTGNLSEDIEVFKQYLDYKYKSNKLIVNKKREKMYLVHENSNEEDVSNYSGRLYVLSIKGIIGLLEYEAIKTPYVITIKSIQFKDPDYYGIGLGSALLKYLQEYASEENVTLIKGVLEAYDVEHYREKLKNFYSKHDFNIDFYHMEVKKITTLRNP